MKVIMNPEYKDETILVGENANIMITPPIDEDYYVAKVELYKDQSINLFPKFMTYGIGFAQEENWNTNSPFFHEAEDIYSHIAENKKYDDISKEECIEAIKILQDIASKLKNDD